MKYKFSIKFYNQLKWIIVLRIILGLMLIKKGIEFVNDKSILRKIVNETAALHDYFWLQSLIPWLNIFCGTLIAIGLLVRLSVVIQIPIIIGAIIFFHSNKEIAGAYELGFSIVILVLLVFFLFIGTGNFAWEGSRMKGNNNSSDAE